MNRSKKLSLLLGVLAVVCVAAIGVTQIEEHLEKIKNSGEVILEIPADDVQSLSWTHGGTTLAFHKEDGWQYDEDTAFPVSEQKIHAFLSRFESFSAAFIIEEVEDYAQYGLGDPICTINLATGNEEYQIQLGDYSTLDSERYVSIGDGNVYLVNDDPLDDFSAELRDLIAHDEIPTVEQASKIEFSGDESYTITYDKLSDDSYAADDVYYTMRDGTNRPLDPDKVQNYLWNLSNLGLTEYVSYNATDEELQSCGLDEPMLTVSIEYTKEDEDGEEVSDTFTLHIGLDPKEKAKQEAESQKSDVKEETNGEETDKEEEDFTAYARVGDSQILYSITAGQYRELMNAGYNDLRHSQVIWADDGDIRQVDAILDGTTYTITTQKTGGGFVWLYQDEELENDNLKNALESLTAVEFTDEPPTQQKELGVTVYLNDKVFPEVEIELYRYDGTRCLAVVDGEPVSLVSRSAVVDLVEAIHEVVLNPSS